MNARAQIAVLLIAAVSNLDNLGVGLALGIRGTRIDSVANLIVAGITMAATAAAVAGGHGLGQLLPVEATDWLGPLIIIVVALATVMSSGGTPRPGDGPPAPRGPRRARREGRGIISRREAIVLGIGLSVNNLGTGVGAGVSGLPVLASALSAGVLSLAFLGAGSRWGSLLGRPLRARHASLLAGMLLLATGALLAARAA